MLPPKPPYLKWKPCVSQRKSQQQSCLGVLHKLTILHNNPNRCYYIYYYSHCYPGELLPQETKVQRGWVTAREHAASKQQRWSWDLNRFNLASDPISSYSVILPVHFGGKKACYRAMRKKSGQFLLQRSKAWAEEPVERLVQCHGNLE